MKKALSIAVLVASLTLSATSTLSAASCSVLDFSGVYSMAASGAVLVAPGFPASLLGPFARVGRVTADGKGNISVANTASYNGTIIPETYPGTYTVGSDCTLDIQPVVGLPLGPNGALVPVPFEFKGSITSGGNFAAVVDCGVGAPCFAAPPGNVIRVLLTRQDFYREACYSYQLFGTYALDMSGTVVTGTVPGPFARDGVLVFNGSSGFTANTVANYGGGSVAVEALSGTYSLDNLCNITLNYTLSGTAHTWTGTLLNLANGANLIVAESGAVITGTLTQQPLLPLP